MISSIAESPQHFTQDRPRLRSCESNTAITLVQRQALYLISWRDKFRENRAERKPYILEISEERINREKSVGQSPIGRPLWLSKSLFRDYVLLRSLVL